MPTPTQQPGRHDLTSTTRTDRSATPPTIRARRTLEGVAVILLVVLSVFLACFTTARVEAPGPVPTPPRGIATRATGVETVTTVQAVGTR